MCAAPCAGACVAASLRRPRIGAAAAGWRSAGPCGCRGRSQDRSGASVVDGPVDGSSYCGWERYEHDLVALTAHPQPSVAMFLTEVCDIAAGGLEDPQAR